MKPCVVCKVKTNAFSLQPYIPQPDCCGACAAMMLILFSKEELATMTLEEIMKSGAMRSYLKNRSLTEMEKGDHNV